MDEITCDGVDMIPTEERPARKVAWSKIKAERDAAQAEVRRLQAAHQEMTEQRDRLACELSEVIVSLSGIEIPHPLGTPHATDRIAWLRRKVTEQATEIARLQERSAPLWARVWRRVAP